MINIAGWLHIIMALFAGVTFIYFLFSYSKNKTRASKTYAWFFFHITFYTFFWGIASLIWPDIPAYSGVGFIIGWVFILFAVYLSFDVTPSYSKRPELEVKRNGIRNTLLLVGIIGLAILIVDFREPLLHEAGFIYWKANTIGVVFLSGITAIASFLWGYSNYQMRRYIEPHRREIQLKLNVLTVDGVMWGVAVVMYTVLNTVSTAIFAFVLMVLSLSSTALVFYISAYVKGDALRNDNIRENIHT